MGRRNLVEGASLSAYDAIFGGDDEEVMASDKKEEIEAQIVDIALSDLHEFKDHPFMQF